MKCFFCVAENAVDQGAVSELVDAVTAWNGTPCCPHHAMKQLDLQRERQLRWEAERESAEKSRERVIEVVEEVKDKM